MPVDVTALDADFLVFSGHKMLAPMGIGVLYGKRALLEDMPPFLQGGEMIETVHWDSVRYAPIPHKFEAGTVNAGGAAALAAAIDYIEGIGFDFIHEQEQRLTRLAMEEMKKLPGIRIIGSDDPAQHMGIVTFIVEGVHPHDVASIFNAESICVRAGHHCAQPLMDHLGVFSTTRVSFYFYNTEDEVRRFVEVLGGIRRQMGYGE
jgi:cysteine desulfurase/selenocysteine lyase